MRYIVQDKHDQKIYLTGHDTAAALRKVQQNIHSDKLDKPDQETMTLAFQFTEQVRRLGQAELMQLKPLNPLFLRWEAFDLGRFDSQLRHFSLRYLSVFLALILVTLLICIVLGVGSSWVIFEQMGTNINFSGLALFAAISPLLKIPHELGHVLVARYFDVRLRKCGLIFIGLLPLPFVDCSMADIDGHRSQRVWISLAGVITDLWLAMLAFVGWHLIAGEISRTLFMNIFIFSSLNSILFNGNPLIRLDGYYAFSDMIGHRNLSTKSAQIYKGFRSWVSSFGRLGARPADRTGWAYLAFGALSGVYKIYVLLLVVWIVLPKLLGLGGLIAAWGALVMFATPLLKEKTSKTQPEKAHGARALFWALAMCVILALAFLPLPLRTTAQLAIDTEDTYTLRVSEPGNLELLRPNGQADKGAPLVQLRNLELDHNIELIGLQIKTQQLAYDTAAGSDPTLAVAAAEQLETLRTDQQQLKIRNESLVLEALNPGYFYANEDLAIGHYLSEGQRLGYFLPTTDTTQFIIQMDERFVSDFENVTPNAQLWVRSEKIAPPTVLDISLKLFQTTNFDNGGRNFQVVLTLMIDPNEALNHDIWAKLDFGTLPLWQHAQRWFERMQQTYLEVRFGQLR